MEVCDICGKTFKNKAGLEGHKAGAHEGRHSPGSPLLKGSIEGWKGLTIALKDLCEDCQGKVKDRVMENLKEISVDPSKGSSEGLMWLILILGGLWWLARQPLELKEKGFVK